MPSSRKGDLLTRRQFVAAGALGSAAIASGCRWSQRSDWQFLSEDQARTLAAICDQIIPADQFPSASEAGVLNYIDSQLMRSYRRHRELYRHGLEQAQAISRQRYGRDLAELTPTQQFEIVSALEAHEGPFFTLARNHTMEGYYGSPRHGGNRDAVSWRMLGLSEPPPLGRAQYDLTKGGSQ
jgi:gluconate 2-dehydrogenase gamma chain